MFDYLFFDSALKNEFLGFLHGKDIATHEQQDDLGQQVSIPEDLADETLEAIDVLYDRLLLRQADLLEGTEDGLEKNVTGVNLVLKDGTACVIRLDPDLVARMLSVMGLKELGELVNTIADQVEHPDNRPLCHV